VTDDIAEATNAAPPHAAEPATPAVNYNFKSITDCVEQLKLEDQILAAYGDDYNYKKVINLLTNISVIPKKYVPKNVASVTRLCNALRKSKNPTEAKLGLPKNIDLVDSGFEPLLDGLDDIFDKDSGDAGAAHLNIIRGCLVQVMKLEKHAQTHPDEAQHNALIKYIDQIRLLIDTVKKAVDEREKARDEIRQLAIEESDALMGVVRDVIYQIAPLKAPDFFRLLKAKLGDKALQPGVVKQENASE